MPVVSGFIVPKMFPVNPYISLQEYWRYTNNFVFPVLLENNAIRAGLPEELGREKLPQLMELHFGSMNKGLEELGGVQEAQALFRDFQRRLYTLSYSDVSSKVKMYNIPYEDHYGRMAAEDLT